MAGILEPHLDCVRKTGLLILSVHISEPVSEILIDVMITRKKLVRLFWFRRFKSGDFDTRDKERGGRPIKFEDAELEALLDEDSSQTQEELAETLGVTQQAISNRLKVMGMVQKQGNWVPYELKPGNIERHICTCELLLKRQNQKGFLLRIVTGDEKWIHYDNPKRRKSWVKRGHASTSTAKPNIHGKKLMLCIWILLKHFNPKTNIIYERFVFQKMDQKSGEAISKYIIRLKEQAQRCNFGDFLQESLRDRFVAGIIDTPTQKKLLQEEGLTFEGALNIALSAESADNDLHNLKRSEDAHRSPQHLHAINNPCKHCVHVVQAMIIMEQNYVKTFSIEYLKIEMKIKEKRFLFSHIHVKCNSTCVRSVVMKSNREFENRAAIIVALRAGRSPKEIVDFLKLPKPTIYRVKKQFDEADSNKEGIATRKKHSRRSDRVRGEEFVKNVKEKIDGNPGKSMRAIAKEMDVGSMTIVRTIHEDLGLKSYALRKGQLLTENMKNNRKGKAAALLNNLKHDSFGMLRFFSDEKNFDVDQKVNPRNDRWICKDPSEIPVVMHTKFPASVMVLGVISSEGDVMPPHFFEKGLRMNADTYINVLETVVNPWMDMVAAGRKYVFQQDSAPAHKAKKTQSWLTLNVPSHWGPDIWPPNSPDCNPLDYYVWGVVERDVNKAPHTTIQSVKKAVHTVMTQMDKVIVAKACASFRTRLETVVANNGNYIE
ncbi:hypothetical protein LAZ67_13001387 [Cordylochernes scorpioides]|uniref:HTH cro/C1-type domain-containing protein n=1 Tax=Cordylochernes scorpioides TaxID=51811 RepID=A0ABY6L3R9_9ARAC|nr:hypothetical protein LAZ67_13001387 [Cordylochernes scorpioides]